MSDLAPLSLQSPVPVWQRPLQVQFGRLAQALGRGAIAGAFGNWEGVTTSGANVLAALGLKREVGAIAWLLVQRALLQAMSDLVKPYQRDLSSKPNFNQLCEQLDRALAQSELTQSELTLSTDFFDRPKSLPILAACQTPYRQWLQSYGLTSHQADAIAKRLPGYFVYALNDQWRQNPNDYAILRDHLTTPFTQAAEREQQWNRYSAWLARQVDEPLFDEAFSLHQIYIPLRAYYERQPQGGQPEPDSFVRGDRQNPERIVVELTPQLMDWVQTADKDDAVRVVCGGPGCGKSSFAKMFAAQLIAEKMIPVLLVPLHQFSLTADLVDAMDDFIQTDFENILPPNPLNKQHMEKRVLLIFDGLDEIVMQGKGATQAVQDFVREVLRKLVRFNQSQARVLVLMTGRDVVVQENRSEFRKEGQILYAMPYFQSDEERQKHQYVGEKILIDRDQRQEWWQKYGRLKGKDYDALPPDLSRPNLAEITAQPLLNYLIALSHDRGEINFSSEESNLNVIYADLLNQVYDRDWAGYQHPRLGNISKADFVRILEEIAIACWHGDGRTTTISKIAERCVSGSLKRILEIFQGGAKEGVTRLLTAFYFRQSDQHGGDATFEFTHKSFGEYLIVRRIVRELGLIQSQLVQHRENPDIGWDEKECLRRWAILCGPTYIDIYLLQFLRDEIKLQNPEQVREWQLILCDLISYVMHYGMPMEQVIKCPTYLKMLLNALHSEETLLATLSSCALVTNKISHIDWSTERMFGIWLGRLAGQRSDHTKHAFSCLNHLDLSSCTLSCRDFVGANLVRTNFVGANLEQANLERANLVDANLQAANLWSAKLEGARLWGTNLEGVTLERADLQDVSFENANLQGANLQRASLQGADLQRVSLQGASLWEANLQGANLQNTGLQGADLQEVNLEETRLWEVDFEEANLERANLRRADLREVELGGANLAGANLTKIIWDVSTKWQNADGLDSAIAVPEEWLEWRKNNAPD